MPSTFGTRLRLQREEQQIPLATIAEQTKIKLSLLEGLERDDVSRWPTGLFRRSYLRAYASAIGLEPDRALQEFQALYPDPAAEADLTEALAQARQQNDQQRRPPTRLRCLIDSAVNALPARHPQAPAKAAPLLREEPPNAGPSEPPILAAALSEPFVVTTIPLPPPTSEEESDVDFSLVARLCTQLARALDVCDVVPVLDEIPGVLGAVGMILWVSDRSGTELAPVFANGYSSDLLSQVTPVSRDSDNAIALAFRTARTRIVDSGGAATGAIVAPLLSPTGCAGVLAIELRNGQERRECVRASAAILAAQLSTLVAAPVLDEAVSA